MSEQTSNRSSRETTDYFYNSEHEETRKPKSSLLACLGDNQNMIWVILLVFLLFNRSNDSNSGILLLALAAFVLFNLNS